MLSLRASKVRLTLFWSHLNKRQIPYLLSYNCCRKLKKKKLKKLNRKEIVLSKTFNVNFQTVPSITALEMSLKIMPNFHLPLTSKRKTDKINLRPKTAGY